REHARLVSLRAFDRLRRPEVDYADLAREHGGLDTASLDDRLPEQVVLELTVRARYAGYIERQHAEVERARGQEDAVLPPSLDYAAVRGLSTEVRQRLDEARPATVGQASRVPGVTPAAVSLLLVHLKRLRAA
ncbi:MAG: tRNA uridine-5-carboxymethylaminomethyl(34) synthesis enzyme MnmG, partial [Proteobacteria bacterium]